MALNVQNLQFQQERMLQAQMQQHHAAAVR